MIPSLTYGTIMNRIFSLYGFLIVGLLFAACGPSTETIIIDRNADAVRAPEGVTPHQRDAAEQVRVLRMGELNDIRSLDPLFAQNPSSLRLTTLLYDQLVGFDKNDNIVPAIASRWEVSSDSLTYTFTLNRNARFHDSSIFTNGVGRRITASDVAFVFRRMASADVPPTAAGMFFDSIRGYDLYVREQRELFRQRDRVINEISGIRAANDSTVVFTLVAHDPQFLEKLASPLASIYPREVFSSNPERLHTSPVGSGPYIYRRSFGDSVFVLLKNEKHYAWANGDFPNAPQRIEILKNANETNLFRQMALGRIDFIADAGPQMLQSMVGPNEEIISSYDGLYDIVKAKQGHRFGLFANPSNIDGFNDNQLASAVRNISSESLTDVSGIRLGIDHNPNFGNTDAPESKFLISYHSDVHSRHTASMLALGLVDTNETSLVRFRIQSRQFHMLLMPQRIEFENNRYLPVYGFPLISELSMPRYHIQKINLGEIHTNSTVWWFDIRSAESPLISL